MTTDKRNAAFIKAARIQFADLRDQYFKLWPTVTLSQFTKLCAARAPSDPTPFDWLMAAALLLRETREDAEFFDRLATEHESEHLMESPHFCNDRTC